MAQQAKIVNRKTNRHGDRAASHRPSSFENRCLSLNGELSYLGVEKPITVPTQDMVFGIYYLTLAVDGPKGEGRVFRHAYEVETAFDAGAIELHAKIVLPSRSRLAPGQSIALANGAEVDAEGNCRRRRRRAGRDRDHAGRLFFNTALPEGFRYINDIVGKRNTAIGAIVEELAASYPKRRWRPAWTGSRSWASATPPSPGSPSPSTTSVTPPEQGGHPRPLREGGREGRDPVQAGHHHRRRAAPEGDRDLDLGQLRGRRRPWSRPCPRSPSTRST